MPETAIPLDYRFEFLTTDLTLRQVETLAAMREHFQAGETWQGWRDFFAVARERLANPDDVERLNALTWGSFLFVQQQFWASLIAADNLRQIAQQMET